MQTLPTQHPGQFCGPHVVCPKHEPLMHDSPNDWQLLHCWPPKPHAKESVPGTHTLPWQQPPQFCGPQNVPMHCWNWHVAPKFRQSRHCWPPKPHAVEESPDTHVLPRQHPEQLEVEHVGWPPQIPPTGKGRHDSPIAPQLTHCWPCWPHALFAFPAMHWSPKQQPVQFCGPHPCLTHCWPTHARPWFAQCRQISPPAPHSFGPVPAKHTLPSQQPLHDWDPQLVTGLPQAWRAASQSWKPSAWQF
jgi:hypothetical protein